MSEFLWSKSGDHGNVDSSIQQFLSGQDIYWDRYLLKFDILGTKAHANGLARIDILTEVERASIASTLEQLGREFDADEFQLKPPTEDCHSAIEIYLTDKLGEVGRKVHAGRSRNDQVQTAMRLYLLDALDRLFSLNCEIANASLTRADSGKLTVMPGYTHLQRAVASTTELWMASFAESFSDIAWLTRQTREWIDASPLGSAAGYGVNLSLDRDGVAKELGFARTQINPMYVQNSRGRFELQSLSCLAQATLELRRLAWDLSLYCCEEFAFVRLPDRYTTGSSIMPNKRNPDTVELLRGQHAIVEGSMAELQSIIALPSAYHRDLQLVKPAVIRAFESSLLAMRLVPGIISDIEFDEQRMRDAVSADMQSTDIAIKRVTQQQMPFRDAYRTKIDNAELAAQTPEQSVADRISLGGCANLGLDRIRNRLDEIIDRRSV